MLILWQLAIIFAFGLLGEITSYFLPVAIPASLLGLLFLCLALCVRLIKIEQLTPTATFFSANMALFFLPSVVNIMQSYHIIAPVVGRLLLICLLTTVITFFAAYFGTRLAREAMKKFSNGRAPDGASV